MTRRLLNLLTFLSLLAAVAVAAVWVRSGFRFDQFFVRTPGRFIVLGLRHGCLAVSVQTYRRPDQVWMFEREGPLRGPRSLDVPNPTVWNRFGLNYVYRESRNASVLGLAVPYWAMCFILAVPPGVRLARLRLRSIQPGTRACRACGYDLRATPDKCPECGTDVTVTSTT